jgi:putative aldouronate transport system substrate-binding protein
MKSFKEKITMSSSMTRRDFVRLGVGTASAVLLSACGGTPTAVPPAATKPAAAPAAAATTAPAPAAAGPAPKLTLWSNMIALNRPEGSDPERYKELQDFVKNAINVMPEGVIPPAAPADAEKLNLLLGSQSESLDMFVGAWDVYQDAVIPINDLLDKYGPNVKKAVQMFKDGHGGIDLWSTTTDSAGKIWGYPRLSPSLHITPIWFRSDWLKALNLKMPSTFDELEATMTAFKSAYPDSVILTSSLSDLQWATVGGFTQYGNSNWIDKSDGSKVKPAQLQPDYPDWVAKMADWYKKGWLFKESFATHDDPEVAKTGKVGIFAGWYSRITIWIERIRDAVPGMDFDFNRTGIKGPKGLMTTVYNGGASAIMITKKCKNPDAAMRYLDWQCSDVENVLTVVYGIKGKDWVWDDELNATYGKKWYIKRLITNDIPGSKVYAGEFMTSTGPVTDLWYGPSDKQWKRHYEYLRDWAYNISTSKQRVDVDVIYDMAAVRKVVPGLNDINRLLSEEVTKFITGVRPLTEWNAFLDQLKSAGMNDYITALTTQYVAKHKA